jgi:biopolymer transport protein ExbB/TolQ
MQHGIRAPRAVVTGLLLVASAAQPLWAAEEAGAEAASMPILDILALGGWVMWPIYLTLAAGLALSISRFLMIRLDQSREGGLHGWNPRGKNAEETLKAISAMEAGTLAQAAVDMLTQFRATRNPESMSAQIERHLTVRQDWFKPYMNWLTFLSESAGALGLLGTVLGMFETFFGGTLDKDKVLHGMGLALITTLVGLVVSLILNFVMTLIRNYFDKGLDRQYQKLTEIRQAMLNAKALGSDSTVGA